MSEELDVFAGAIAPGSKPAPETQPDGAAQAPASQPAAQPQQPRQGKKFHGGRKQYQRQQQKNNSPIRGSNGEESVNPLLNAPLPPEQKSQEPEAAANPNRNPELPEYRLADIQTWTAPQIVERMMPGADQIGRAHV